MFDWGALINTGIQVGGSLGGSAIQGSYGNQQANIMATAQTDQALIAGNAQISSAGWQTLGGIYSPSQVLASQFGMQTESRASIEKARIEAEAQKKQTMLLALLAGVAVVVIAIVLLNKK